MKARDAPSAFRIPISRVRSVIVVYIASMTTSMLTTADSPTSVRRKTPRYGMLFSMFVTMSRVS